MNIKALAHSTSATIGLIVLMTIVSEQNKPFKEILAKIGGHHWIGKGVVSIVVFIGLYLLFKSIMKKGGEDKAIAMAVGVTIVSGLVIFGFYALHTFTGIF